MKTSIAPTGSHDAATTTILLSNLHCSSCVRTVEDTLRQYTNQVLNISTSTVTQTVTIKHVRGLPASLLAKSLCDAGFDVQSTWAQRGGQRIPTLSSSIFSQAQDGSRASLAFPDFSCGLLQSPEQRRIHDAMHSVYCEQCALEECDTRSDDRFYLTRPDTISQSYDDKDLESNINIIVKKPESRPRYKVVIAIHGMTCSACVGRVAEVLEAKQYVEYVSVNLIGHSATLRVNEPDKGSELVEEVEDIGYDAALESYEHIANATARSPSNTDITASRTVAIKVAGMYCQHCPVKIKQTLQEKFQACKVSDVPKADNLFTITYTPRAPQFTIRDILDEINLTDAAFTASVFRPPSLEERAREIQTRQRQMVTIRFIISAVLAIPTLVLGVIIMSLLPESSMSRRYWMTPSVGQTPRVQWPLLAFATVIYFFAADVFHRRALKEVYMMWRRSSKVPIRRRLYRFGSMDMLLSLGTSVAFIGSVVILIISSLQTKPSMSNDSMDTTTYFDAVVFLTLFLLGGRLLEAYGKAQTADAVTSLGKLRPSEALLMSTTRAKSVAESTSLAQIVPVDHLEAGDIIMVPAGGSPACDGIIHDGTTAVDESSLTGESRSVSRTVGDEVFAGTINITNMIQVQVTGVAGVSLLDRIIDTVREGQAKRAPIERIADVLTGYFVPGIIAVALIDWIVWLSLGMSGRVSYVEVGTGGWVFWSLQFAIAVLVVACPCGIGLAAPTALFVGTGLAAKQGILVKGGGEAFQEASVLDCVVFDKTGTITEGSNLKITATYSFNNTVNSPLLGALAALEGASNHPLARAVVMHCNAKDQQANVNMHSTQEVSGKGMIGQFDVNGVATDIFIGNRAMVEYHQIAHFGAEAQDVFENWSREGKTVMLVGSRSQGRPFTLDMMLAASDAIRGEAPGVVAALHARGTEVWLLSGDNQITAKVVAESVGIPSDHVLAGILPHEKADKIRLLQQGLRKVRRGWLSGGKGHISNVRASVAMVGDGINDAPALATADVGIAMGSGSDTAISSASFVLLSSDLTAVLTLLKLSKAVIRRVQFNFGWALTYNLLMLPLAAGVLFPAVSNGSHIRLDPVWASLAMALSSVSVVTSSLLLKTRLPVVGFRH